MTTERQIEAGARAVCKIRFMNGGVEDDDGWDDATPSWKEECRKEAQAVLAAAEQAAWEDISSAQRDGRVVYLADEDGDCRAGFWSSSRNIWVTEDGNFPLFIRPVRWRLLPSPPMETKL